MDKNRIHFIINPVSGGGKCWAVKSRVEKLFPDAQIHITRGKNDAFLFAQKSMTQGAELIVCCGGDGTLNEAASALAGKNTPLAIVPIGSGNGLARHLKIPLKPEKALQNILHNNLYFREIDCGKVNDRYFFSNIGIGFDAEVIKEYAAQKQRKFWAYLKCGISAVFRYRPVNISLNADNEEFTGKTMLLNIANSNCLGYGITITPKARLEDGFLDINLIPKISWLHFSWLAAGILLKKNFSKKRRIFREKKLNIRTDARYMQIDGEFIPLQTGFLEISVIEKALKILC